jgi:hypothetical protein
MIALAESSSTGPWLRDYIATPVIVAFILWAGNEIRKALAKPKGREVLIQVLLWVALAVMELGWLYAALGLAHSTRNAPSRTLSIVCWMFLFFALLIRLVNAHTAHRKQLTALRENATKTVQEALAAFRKKREESEARRNVRVEGEEAPLRDLVVDQYTATHERIDRTTDLLIDLSYALAGASRTPYFPSWKVLYEVFFGGVVFWIAIYIAFHR